MKLYNRTKIPDSILTSLLVKAGKAVGARTSKVVVQVNETYRGGGYAIECGSVRWAKSKKRKTNRWVDTDGGAIRISLPVRNKFYDRLSLVERFFNTAMHEWGHIKDYQDGGKYFSRGRKRRPKWADRPEEIRACAYVEQAKAEDVHDKCADEILNFAVEVESIYGKAKELK